MTKKSFYKNFILFIGFLIQLLSLIAWLFYAVRFVYFSFLLIIFGGDPAHLSFNILQKFIIFWPFIFLGFYVICRLFKRSVLIVVGEIILWITLIWVLVGLSNCPKSDIYFLMIIIIIGASLGWYRWFWLILSNEQQLSERETMSLELLGVAWIGLVCLIGYSTLTNRWSPLVVPPFISNYFNLHPK